MGNGGKRVPAGRCRGAGQGHRYGIPDATKEKTSLDDELITNIVKTVFAAGTQCSQRPTDVPPEGRFWVIPGREGPPLPDGCPTDDT